MGGSSRGRRRKETVTLYQHPRDTKMAQYWILAIELEYIITGMIKWA